MLRACRFLNVALTLSIHRTTAVSQRYCTPGKYASSAAVDYCSQVEVRDCFVNRLMPMLISLSGKVLIGSPNEKMRTTKRKRTSGNQRIEFSQLERIERTSFIKAIWA